MALPINIEDLVHGATVEWERLEFKQGWNPEDVLHSACAFANDLHNWGGGYIIIGVAENNGRPIFPPAGLESEQLDAIQKKILELGHKIQPSYFPVMQPYHLQDKQILVLWCPAGDNRMYTAPTSLGKESGREPYVRIGSNSVIARGETLRQLQELTARIPYDDRINQLSSLQDMDLGLIQAYLHEVKSDLLEESKTMSFEDLCRAMLIAKGANENIRPVNVGLLFFSKQPEHFFSRCQIELVWHKENTGSNFSEHYFKGPLHKQLRDALSFLQTNIISEQVIKHGNKAEADRFYNFPYAAVEEALSNAVYHKSYEIGSPIEVQVWPDKIEILSYPGPVPPVNATILKTQKRIVSREYRNRRIGDFLKELGLTEGRGTGFPTIYKAMSDNGSPDPIFDTDTDFTCFLTTLPAHSLVGSQESNGESNGATTLLFSSIEEIVAFSNGASNGVSNQESNQVSNQVIEIINTEIHDRVVEMLELLSTWIKRELLFEKMGLSNQTKNSSKYLEPLIKIGWVEKQYPEIKNRNQTYQTTASGKRILSLIKK
jgi:ATP-dependent DNA helicase RecG